MVRSCSLASLYLQLHQTSPSESHSPCFAACLVGLRVHVAVCAMPSGWCKGSATSTSQEAIFEYE